MKHRAFAETLPLLVLAAVLVPVLVLAQEGAPPTMETRPAEPTLTPQPEAAAPVKKYVDEVKQILGGAPPGGPAEGARPAPKEAEKGGAVSVQRDLLWEEDLDEYNRQRTLRPKKEILRGGVADVHVVQPGDTLWDLSSRYMGSPWRWPRVWSYNPHITNPHWIYPGQVIRFGPPGTRRVEEPEPPPVVGRRPEKIIPGHAGLTAFLHTAFVTKEELKHLGIIENSREDNLLLSRFDEAYVRFQKPKDVRAGDRFLTVRVAEEVKHPASGEAMGHLVQVTGEIKVTAAGDDKRFFTGHIGRSWRSVERGNRVLPYEELMVKIGRVPNKKNLRGYVIASIQEKLLGEHQLAFLDLGAKHGVEYGNRFVVARRGDGYLRPAEYEDNLPKMPLEEIGEVIVLSVKPETCTGIMRATKVEVEVGDKVEMRQGE